MPLLNSRDVESFRLDTQVRRCNLSVPFRPGLLEDGEAVELDLERARGSGCCCGSAIVLLTLHLLVLRFIHAVSPASVGVLLRLPSRFLTLFIRGKLRRPATSLPLLGHCVSLGQNRSGRCDLVAALLGQSKWIFIWLYEILGSDPVGCDENVLSGQVSCSIAGLE